MNRLRRQLHRLASSASITLLLLTIALWLRSGSKMDVLMLPDGSGGRLLVTSHQSRWLEITRVNDWIGPPIGYWHGANNRDIGPLLFWQTTYQAKFVSLHRKSGVAILPRSSTYGEVETDHSFTRANQLGFPGAITLNSPDWLAANVTSIDFPIYWLILAATMLAAMVHQNLLRQIAADIRARERERKGHCGYCGYDLRASPERCPECGAESVNLLPARNT